MIEFNGVRSTAVGVFVEKFPPRPIPKRKCETFSVPGRSGDVIVYEDAWENVRQRYDIYLSAEKPGLPLVAARVARWLMQPGYQRLEDEYDRDTFRLAAFSGPTDLENTLNAFGRAAIEFDCQPQRFLKSGWQPSEISSGTVLRNPTGYTARPMIYILGSGAASITMGSRTIAISAIANGMYLDCAEEEAYTIYQGAVYPLNTRISGNYPKLEAGDTAISWTGSISKLILTPRWFEI